MPYRKTPIVTGEFYHVFNRSIGKQPIYTTKNDYKRFIALIEYYRYKNPPIRYSHYINSTLEQKLNLRQNHPAFLNPMIKILAYCVMPNHFHFLLQPIMDNGVSDFMRNISHSYSKYFNTKYKRTGSIVQSMFHVVHIETADQLLHVSRYIHLNPSTAYIVKSEDLLNYPWSSFPDYTFGHQSFIDTQPISSSFSSQNSYKQFVFDH